MFIPEPVFYPILVATILGLFAIFRYFILRMLKDNELVQTELRIAIKDLRDILVDFKEDITDRLTKLETEHKLMHCEKWADRSK